MQITSGISNLSSIPTRSHSVLQNLANNDHPWYSAEPNRMAATSFAEGTFSNLPVSPTAGNLYYATDTQALYQCFVTGTWVQVNDITIPTGAAQGSILYYDGHKWNYLAAGVSGQALITGGSSANPSWGSTSGAQHIFTAGFTRSANTTEQTIDTYSVPANSLGTSHGIIALYTVTAFGNSAGTTTWRAYYGGSVIASFTTGSSVGTNANVGQVEIGIWSGGATNAQNGYIKFFYAQTNGALTASTTYYYMNTGTLGVDSTSAQTYKFTTQCSANGAGAVDTIPYGIINYF